MSANCEDCGRRYGDEYGFPDMIIPAKFWKIISTNHDDSGLLCPSCIIKRLADEALTNVPAYFASGPCCLLNTCPECGELCPDDDRVKAGMKCCVCAGYAGAS